MLRLAPSPASPSSISILGLAALLLVPACKSEPAPSTTPGEPAAGEASAPAEASGPALWTVRDEDTTIYLFGTVHVLKPETQWRSPGLEAAFDEAAVVYFEADVASAAAQAKMVALMPKLGVFTEEGKSLATVLEPEDKATVDEALAIAGLPQALVEPMKPWLVAMTLESQSMVARGYDPRSGVEAVLGEEAEAAGKELRYFETVEEQLGFFASLPEADQVSFLVDTAEAVRDEPEAIDELVDAWAAGDVEQIVALMDEDDSTSAEAVNEVLLVNRNRNWVGQLQTVLAEEPGVFFVAVGAAHLAGDDGVPAMLREAGVEVSGP